MNKNKYFYLHIPKTAGSSMNKLFAEQFMNNELLLHIESEFNFQKKEDVEKADSYKLLSGHFTLAQMQNKLNVFEKRITISTFRIPLEQVVSHLKWVRKLGEDSEVSRLKDHNEVIKKIVARLILIDLSEANEIAMFIKWLEENNYDLFHNVQTKYLCGGASNNFSPALINQALINLNKIDYVGTVERFSEFVSLLCYHLGWKVGESEIAVENRNTDNYGLDITESSIREALQPLIQWDNIIYRAARERFIDDMHNFLSKLEKSKWPRFSSVREPFVLTQFIKESE